MDCWVEGWLPNMDDDEVAGVVVEAPKIDEVGGWPNREGPEKGDKRQLVTLVHIHLKIYLLQDFIPDFCGSSLFRPKLHIWVLFSFISC